MSRVCIFHTVQALGVNFDLGLCAAHGPGDTLFRMSARGSPWRCMARGASWRDADQRARLGFAQRLPDAGLEQLSGPIQDEAGGNVT